MSDEMSCPECGRPVVLREWGVYGGTRSIDATGNILPDSYIEHFSENRGFELACTNCRYTDQEIEVTETQVRRSTPALDDGRA